MISTVCQNTQKDKELINMLPEETLNNIERQLDMYQYALSRGDNKWKFDPLLCAPNIVFQGYDDDNKINGLNRGILVTRDSPVIYRYNGSFYQDDGESFIRGKLQKFLNVKVTEKGKDEVINWIKDCEDIKIDRSFFDQHPEKIVLENGTYDINNGEIDENNISDFKSTSFPVRYVDDAKCPKWENFLSEVLYESDIPVLQEIFGYCFYQRFDFQKILLLVGEGANGKSVTLFILENLLGTHNISTTQLQTLTENRFALSSLYNKYANICNDIDKREIKNVGLLKAMYGGDLLSSELKNVQGFFTFRNFAKGIFSCNTVPECKDLSFAYKRRWIVIKYPNTFDEKGAFTNPNIRDELLDELPGIFLWCMEGLKRLLKNKQFSKHQNLDDAIEFQSSYQNEVSQFCRSCIMEGDFNDYIQKHELYERFKEYSIMVGFRVISQAQFTTRFKQFAPASMKDGQLKEGGKRVFRGIKYTTPKTEESESQKNDEINKILDDVLGTTEVEQEQKVT